MENETNFNFGRDKYLDFSLGIGVAAFALDAEGTYLLSPKRESKLRGFSLSVSGEVYPPNLLLDGSFF